VAACSEARPLLVPPRLRFRFSREATGRLPTPLSIYYGAGFPAQAITDSERRACRRTQSNGAGMTRSTCVRRRTIWESYLQNTSLDPRAS